MRRHDANDGKPELGSRLIAFGRVSAECMRDRRCVHGRQKLSHLSWPTFDDLVAGERWNAAEK